MRIQTKNPLKKSKSSHHLKDELIKEMKKLLKLHPAWTKRDAVSFLLNRTMRYTPEFAILEALHERLKNFKKNPIADQDLAPVIAFLLYLRNFPDWSENVPDHVLTILIDEELYDVNHGVTDKGLEFIQNMCDETDDEGV